MKHGALLGKISAIGVSAACCLALVGCAGSNYGFTGGTAATVNGAEIQEDTVTKYIQDFRTSSQLTSDDEWGKWLADNSFEPSTVRDQVIDYYVEQELINQACEERGITVDDSEIQSQVDSMKSNYTSDEAWKQALETAGITEDQYHESIERGLKEQQLQSQVASDTTASDEEVLNMLKTYSSMFDGAKRSSHILFAAGDEATAREVLDKINAGELTFEDAASQYSTDTASAVKSGDVGWDATNSFVEAYQTALDGLSKGQVSDLVNSDFGIHIIKCTDVFTADGAASSLDSYPSEFVDYIRTIIVSQNQSSAYQQWLADYKAQADIQLNDMPSNVPYNLDMSQYSSDDSSSDSAEDESQSDPSEQAEQN